MGRSQDGKKDLMKDAPRPGKSPGGRILVFVGLPGGELDATGKGILSEASRLSNILGDSWSAVSFAGEHRDVSESFGEYGVPGITVVEAAPEDADCLEIQGSLLVDVARNHGANVFLLAHDDLGASLAPFLAAALGAAIFTDAVALERCEEGLKIRRQALGAQILESRVWNGTGPLVLTFSRRALSPVVPPWIRPSRPFVNRWSSGTAIASARTRIVERIPPDPRTVDLAEAEVIFSAGKGCDRESFERLQELSRLLNASFGVTRPVFDLGWSGFDRMVGQTGKTVAPRLYLAMGISGSMHHVGGIKDSGMIVAVNSDPNAPIFPNSDEGFVADLRDVLPRLLQRVKDAKGSTE